jgi:hypothetical protein
MKISVQDMIDIVKVIDACSERGAFTGEELLPVGSLRAKIVKFVEHATNQSEEKSNEATRAESG